MLWQVTRIKPDVQSVSFPIINILVPCKASTNSALYIYRYANNQEMLAPYIKRKLKSNLENVTCDGKPNYFSF